MTTALVRPRGWALVSRQWRVRGCRRPCAEDSRRAPQAHQLSPLRPVTDGPDRLMVAAVRHRGRRRTGSRAAADPGGPSRGGLSPLGDPRSDRGRTGPQRTDGGGADSPADPPVRPPLHAAHRPPAGQAARRATAGLKRTPSVRSLAGHLGAPRPRPESASDAGRHRPVSPPHAEPGCGCPRGRPRSTAQRDPVESFPPRRRSRSLTHGFEPPADRRRLLARPGVPRRSS